MLLSEAIKAARQGFLPSSLVGRVFALYCLTWMLCVSIGGAMFIKNEFEERIEAIQRQSVMLIELTSQVTSEAAVIGDYDSVQRVLDISVSNSFFFIAQYIDLSGGKLQSRANLPAQRGAVARLIEPSIEERLPPVNRSITVGGKDYGILRFQFEARSLSNSLQDFTLVTFLVSLVSFSLGILLLWIPLRRWLRPLSDVTRGNEHAAVIGMTPELMQSAPAEFHAVLSQVVTSAEQLQTQLEEKERNISGLMEVATKLKGGESANEELISTKLSIAEAIDAISKMVSERAAINSALVAAKHSAEEANHAKTAFLAAISHDIRTPMNGILAMANVLHEEESLQANNREIAGTIFRSARSLLTLLNDVLDISQIESGKMEFHGVDFDVDELVDDCISTFAQSAVNNQTSLVYPEKTGARFVSDAPRIRQMLSNLISNAIKFAPGGNVSVSIGIMRAGEEPRTLSVIVKDDGPGIPIDQQKKLFQPFSQLEEKRTHRHGSGLGLSIVRKLCELMGGSAGVQSTVGEGSIFYFHVPCMDSVSDTKLDSRASNEPQENTEAKSDAGKLLSGKKIMVVDDTHSNLFVLEVLLKKLGAQVWAFDNAEEALSVFEHGQSVDLVLMDLQMPKMDGVEATSTLRNWEQLNGKPSTPVIAVTAAAYTADRDACLAAGMNGFLTKPVMMGPLRETLLPILQAAEG